MCACKCVCVCVCCLMLRRCFDTGIGSRANPAIPSPELQTLHLAHTVFIIWFDMTARHDDKEL